jgi:hypothetical protein
VLQRGLQIVVLILIGALLGAAQCDFYCSAAACASVGRGVAGCHEHSQNHERPKTTCLHRHSQLCGPESRPDLAKRPVEKTFDLPFLLVKFEVTCPWHGRESRIQHNLAPPPANLTSPSVLRI